MPLSSSLLPLFCFSAHACLDENQFNVKCQHKGWFWISGIERLRVKFSFHEARFLITLLAINLTQLAYVLHLF